jgi:glycosyltransferase involved in cell wall biosynthesis
MSLRVALVTRRFWPWVGRTEATCANLAAGLQSRGAEVTVLTPRWQPEWPSHISHRGANVERMVDPPRGRLSTWRYRRELRSWLREQRAELDAVLVVGLREDSYAVVNEANKLKLPVGIIADGLAAKHDLTWQTESRAGQSVARVCKRAGAIAVSSPMIQQLLLMSGYSLEKTVFAPPGVLLPPPRSAKRRNAARTALASGNRMLRLEDSTPLVVFAGALVGRKGLNTLIDIWPQVNKSLPDARLWIAGDGPDAEVLQRRINQHMLNARVWLVGSFDSVDDLYAAADVFVMPSHEEELSLALIEAQASGLPVIASQIAGNRSLVEHLKTGLLVKPGEGAAWSMALVKLLHDNALRETLGQAARRFAAESFNYERMLMRYEQLLLGLVRSAT